ncbi:MAG: hypothetical protein ACUVV0_04915 [Anaerolineae bacterium]
MRLELVEPKTLTPNPHNWRKHPEAQCEALAAVLDEVSWAGVALYNEATSHLIDGHLRRDLAIERGEPIPVLIGSWTEERGRRILATVYQHVISNRGEVRQRPAQLILCHQPTIARLRPHRPAPVAFHRPKP